MATTLGALLQGREGQGREDLGGKRGIQKREEEAPRPSAAVALLCRPMPLDLGVRLSPASPLPCGGWGRPVLRGNTWKGTMAQPLGLVLFHSVCCVLLGFLTRTPVCSCAVLGLPGGTFKLGLHPIRVAL